MCQATHISSLDLHRTEDKMIKNMIHLEVRSSDRSYQFVCSNESPLGEIHDVLCQMKAEIIKKINEVQNSETTTELEV
jgi:hypothetical protein